MKHNPTPPNAKNTSSTPVVAAIDLGYGFKKYAVHTVGKTIEDSFTSFAPSATGAGSLSGNGALSKLRVVPVEVNNKTYLIGVDSVRASDVHQEHHRDLVYWTSNTYHALTLGTNSSPRGGVKLETQTCCTPATSHVILNTSILSMACSRK